MLLDFGIPRIHDRGPFDQEIWADCQALLLNIYERELLEFFIYSYISFFFFFLQNPAINRFLIASPFTMTLWTQLVRLARKIWLLVDKSYEEFLSGIAILIKLVPVLLKKKDYNISWHCRFTFAACDRLKLTIGSCLVFIHRLKDARRKIGSTRKTHKSCSRLNSR